MGIVRALPDVEDWLTAEAESWSLLSDRDYIDLVRRWRVEFLPLIAFGPSFRGERAMQILAKRLLADVYLFSGVEVLELSNTGGRWAAGYRAVGLPSLWRKLANQRELVVVAGDLSWSCVFSHEAGYWVSECLYEQPPQTGRSVADAFGTATILRSGEDILAQVRADRDEWIDPQVM